ncbi:dolichyl-diphosphooligosaccharide--protein glycosyltransferase subunit 2 [Paenibacillus soyae]|uniref:Dolichyl-diphosphooligosaccharide--protein glycosyltransferase subunit 2 n=1 Tax=Paenibacillus soyae TaxID=2969249 RepID=A0A9X2MQV7_9BACL|nr:dolichyl-diphosphooligosaccharide--protein glycosyltransferase subunit 2 [Paenibacillus soyae]MCR2804121.1 dolichyl-diphosphooligosaccharide--protein glycosyltransferase subunit 2 [Paenibacillus soyae]
MGTHLQRALSSIWLGSFIWLIYNKGQWSFDTALLLAIGVYLAGCGIRYTFLSRRSGHAQEANFPGKPLAGTVLWTVVFAIAQFGLVHLTYRIFNDVAGGVPSAWTYTFIVLFTLFAIWLAVTLSGALLMLAGLAKGAENAEAERKLLEVPLAAFKLLAKRGTGLIGRGTAALLFVWMAFLPVGEQPAGTTIGFLVLLLSMDWLHAAPAAVQESEETRETGRKGWRWTAVVILAVFLLFYIFLFSYFSGPSIAFVGGALAGLLIYFLCWGIVKLRLFAVLKWLMALFIYPSFAAWVFWMWFISQ